MLTCREHILLDSSTEDQRIFYSQEVKTCDWQKLYTLQDELKELYADTFPDRVGTMIMKYSKEEVRQKIASLNLAYLDTLYLKQDTREQIVLILSLQSKE